MVTRGHSLVAFIRVARLISSDYRAEGCVQRSSWQHGDRLRLKWCLYGGLHPSRAGAGARSEEHRDWLSLGTRRRSHTNPLAGDGHFESETSTHHTVQSPGQSVSFSVA